MSTEKNPTTGLTLDVFGQTVEFLTSPQETQDDLCVLKGRVPPGVVVPLHSHPVECKSLDSAIYGPISFPYDL